MLDSENDGQNIAKINAILEVELGIDPNELSDIEWAEKFQQWNYANRVKLKAQEAVFEKALMKTLVEILSKFKT